ARRDHRHDDPRVRHGHLPHIHLRGVAAPVADSGLGNLAEHGHANLRAWARRGRILNPDHPREHARGHRSGLHPNGAQQGAARTSGDRSPRAEECADPGRDDHRAGDGGPHHGLVHHRVALQRAGNGPPLRDQHPPAGLPDHHGNDAALRAPHRDREPDRRHLVRRPRSTDQGALVVTAVTTQQRRVADVTVIARKQRSLWRDALYRLVRNRAAVVGLSVGMLAGYVGGVVDDLLMRATDVVYAFPDLLFVILIVATLRGTVLGDAYDGLLVIFVGIAVVNWVGVARLVRGQVLSVKNRDFVEAARAIGAGPGRIMRRHIFPNILAPIIVTVAFAIPGAMLTESVPSFLGIGIRPPTPTWGVMINEGFVVFSTTPWVVLLPSICISIVLLAF